ncbi:tryptophan halogenase family protein [Cellvibrio sp. pealriver]|uniref:tryptophan halogenase family protein n=1 Tax=Cellvibrio sp. pealriver TaxID=1622269 RepID=UPI00066FF1A9|nr:tryptophan halogenase family protein [Cellvibrio sp. pealriver]
MSSLVNHVLVVGGGTAGWLSAAILAKQLNSNQPGAVKVTLVESPDIPILGVGEGTWPTMRTTLQTLGVNESEFMRECDATFKQGSEFVNWIETPTSEKTNRYFHPLSAVFHASYNFNLAPYWLLKEGNDGLPYDLAVATQSRICQLGLAPKKITTPEYVALQNYSYHLNANKFADFMAKFAVSKLGVQHLRANVGQVKLDEHGNIHSVCTDNPECAEIAADFFIDCSGSRALLIEKALGIKWHSISDVIFNDTALAMQVPYENADDPIATHTIATAQENGWTWDIGLHNRRGVGYVYSSRHTTDERAEEVLRQHIGKQSNGIEARKIPLKLGYREKFWHKNCVAIGMSAAFIEPLEASAIFLIEAAANMLADQFPRDASALPYVEEKYNKTFRLRWDKSVDFVKLHYCISRRRDTQYWIDNCDEKSIPATLLAKLNHWRSHIPSKYDFDYAYEPFVLDSYLFVLYGMQYPTNLAHNQSTFQDREVARKKFMEINNVTAMLAKELPNQRELVEKVYKYGFQRV